MKKYTATIHDQQSLQRLKKLIHIPQSTIYEYAKTLDFNIINYECCYIPLKWDNYFEYGDKSLTLYGNILISSTTIMLDAGCFEVKINYEKGNDEIFYLKAVKATLPKFPLQIFRKHPLKYEVYNIKWSNEYNKSEEVKKPEDLCIENYEILIYYQNFEIFREKVNY